MSTLGTLQAALLAISTTAASLINTTRQAFSDGSWTQETVRYLSSETQGLLDDAKALRASLDLLDVASERLIDDAAQTLSLLAWERESRHALQVAVYQVQRLREALATLDAGTTKTIHVSQAGETLQGIAARYLGSWQEWPRLLDANPSLAAGPLPSGTVVAIPDRLARA